MWLIVASFLSSSTELRTVVFSNLIRHIEDYERALKLWSWGVLKILHILRDDLTVADQEALWPKTIMMAMNTWTLSHNPESNYQKVGEKVVTCTERMKILPTWKVSSFDLQYFNLLLILGPKAILCVYFTTSE